MNRRKSLKLISFAGVASLFSSTMFASPTTAITDICLKAWKSLGWFNSTLYQFRYIAPQENLPKVFLYGDSISIAYTEYVRASLEGKAFVCRIHKNGKSSHNFIKGMTHFHDAMFEPKLKGGWDFDWDVIHFNVGLHDLKYLNEQNLLDLENGTQVSSIDVYKKNLRKIVEYLKKNHPNSKLIFATTTPVPEGAKGRIKGDQIKYNKAALEVLKHYPEVHINDLQTFSIDVWKKYGKNHNDVHYKPEGARLQGIEVAKVIANQLGITTVECPSAEEIEQKAISYRK